MKFNLGDKVKDAITGFSGIIIGRTEWLNRCVRYGIQSEKLTKENKLPESQWIDEEQLLLVKAGVIKVDKPVRTGGPKPAPTRQQDPSQ